MTALTTARVASPNKRIVRRYKLDLAASVKAIQGGACMVIQSGTGQGYAAPADGTKIGKVVGVFLETIDNSAGSIGALKALVEFGHDRELTPFVNDVGNLLTHANYEGEAYTLDDQTVSGTGSSSSTGALFEVDGNGVAWVEVGSSFSVPDGSISASAPVDPSSTAASAGVATTSSAYDHKHHIALALPTAEGLMSADQASAWHGPVADLTALAGIPAANRTAGMRCVVLSDIASEVSTWQFHATSTASDTSSNLVKAPTAGSGRWLRADKQVALFLPVDKTTADNATIFTVPVGARLKIGSSNWWEVTTSWTGGSSAAIGIHASPTGWSTKGDILGGATGDVLATLVSTDTRMTGTVGAKVDTAAHGRLIAIAADTLKFDRITDLFTAGAANVRILVDVLDNLGA